MWVQLLRNADRLGIAPPDLSLDSRAQFLRSCQILEQAASELGFGASKAAAERAFKEGLQLLAAPIGHDAHRLDQVVSLVTQLLQVFGDEMQGLSLFTLPPKHALYFSDEAHFGQAVEDAFPSASFDIGEAAKCRAVGRWTASVMHLMRVLEAGLAVLAQHYGIPADANWNQTLNQIETKTREIGRRTHGADAEQWAAEAATYLRGVKNAWRNHAMHPKQSYDEERCVAIFDSAASFMKHLATHLSESDLLEDLSIRS